MHGPWPYLSSLWDLVDQRVGKDVSKLSCGEWATKGGDIFTGGVDPSRHHVVGGM